METQPCTLIRGNPVDEWKVGDDANIQKLFDKRLKQIEDENKVKKLREEFSVRKNIRIKTPSKSFLEQLKTFFSRSLPTI
jgi:hypothetical protein